MAKRNLVFKNNPLMGGPGLAERQDSVIPYRKLSIDLLDPDPNQPRVSFDEQKLEELTGSIKRYGILSPILVRKGKAKGRYQIVAGERRFRAAGKAGLSEVPVLVEADETDSPEGVLSLQLVENLQRADLTPLERAHAIGALKEAFSLSVRQVADRLGISKSGVQRSLDLLDLPDDLLNALRQGVPESKILLLAKVESKKERQELLKDVENVSRDEIKFRLEASQPAAKRNGKKKATNSLGAEDRRIVDEIQRAIGLKVSMKRSSRSAEGGRLSIDFYSDEDLQELFRMLVALD